MSESDFGSAGNYSNDMVEELMPIGITEHKRFIFDGIRYDTRRFTYLYSEDKEAYNLFRNVEVYHKLHYYRTPIGRYVICTVRYERNGGILGFFKGEWHEKKRSLVPFPVDKFKRFVEENHPEDAVWVVDA